MGLGKLGLGEREEAGRYFARAREVEASHMMAWVYGEIWGG